MPQVRAWVQPKAATNLQCNKLVQQLAHLYVGSPLELYTEQGYLRRAASTKL